MSVTYQLPNYTTELHAEQRPDCAVNHPYHMITFNDSTNNGRCQPEKCDRYERSRSKITYLM